MKTRFPREYVDLWDELRSSSLVRIENAAQWNMSAKRMETQAKYGDMLITLGGTEGVLYRPTFTMTPAGRSCRSIFRCVPKTRVAGRRYSLGMASSNSRRLFQIACGGELHHWINRIRFPARQSVAWRVEVLVVLLELLEPPTAFAVRLLNEDHEEDKAVQDFFDTVVEPVMVGELGYRLTVINGRQAYDRARIDDEISPSCTVPASSWRTSPAAGQTAF